jgi:hypothetical protein
VIAGWQVHAFGDRSFGVVDVGSEVATRDVDEDVANERPVLVSDRRWRGREAKVRELRERDLCALARRDQDPLEALERASAVTEVADVDALALPAFDGL